MPPKRRPHGVSSNAAIVIPAAQLPDDVIVPDPLPSSMGTSTNDASMADLSSVTFTLRESHTQHSLTETAVPVPLVGSSQLVASHAENEDDLVVVTVDPSLVYAQLLQTHPCHDAITLSSKLVILDTAMLLRKAFYVLIYNGVRMALLYDSRKAAMVDCLSTTDLVHAIFTFEKELAVEAHLSVPGDGEDRYVQSPMIDAYLGETTVGQWLEQLESKELVKPLTTASITSSLLSAVALMSEHRLHRIFVNDVTTNNAIGVLSYQRILRFMVTMATSMPTPEFMSQTPLSLGIGVWGTKLKSVHMTDTLLSCLKLMIDHDISGVPIVDQDGVLVEIYTRFDCISLVFHSALTSIRETSMTTAIRLKQALLHKSFRRPSSSHASAMSSVEREEDDDSRGVKLVTCSHTDSLHTIMRVIVEHGVYRVILVDHNRVAKGVITAADLIRFVALKPAEKHMLELNEG